MEALKHLQNEQSGKNKILHCHRQPLSNKSDQIASNSYKRHFIIGRILDEIEIMVENGQEIHIFWYLRTKVLREMKRQMNSRKKLWALLMKLTTLLFIFLKFRPLRWWSFQKSGKNNGTSDKGRMFYSILPRIAKTAWFKETSFERANIVF